MIQKMRVLRLWLPLALMFTGMLNAGVVQWVGGPILTPVVTDQNINVANNNILIDDVLVHAVSQDIVISVTTNDSTITSTANTATFCLRAEAGRTITMNLETNDLFFIAGANLTVPFIIDFQGPGSLVINIEGSATFALTTAPGATVGTWFFEIMDPVNNPTVTFARNPALTSPNVDATVLVDSLCLISYLASEPVAVSTERGTIQFNATNTIGNTGSLILQINDKGSVIIGGHDYDNSTCPAFDNIDMSMHRGLAAIMQVANSTPLGNTYAPFIVQNFNNTYSPNIEADPFCQDNYTGLINGFTLQSNAQLILENQTYLFYIGNTINVAAIPDVLGSCGWALHQVIKDRNPSAFVIDGSMTSGALPAQIFLDDTSAIYLASNANCGNCAQVTLAGGQFTQTNPSSNDVTGAGNTVFDVEGPVTVFGGPRHNSAINVVSLVVALQGGSVLIEDNTTVNFPLRTFATNSDLTYQRFDRANILVNNTLTLEQTNLKHDDQAHVVTPLLWMPDNSLVRQPEPTYIGGERAIVSPNPCPAPGLPNCGPSLVNSIDFINSCFLLHTSANATGLTFRVPNFDPNGNISCFRFYSNGLCVDNGVGRSLVLGSITGAIATDGQHVIDPNAYIDVMQTTTGTNPLQTLFLVTGYNNQKVTQGLTGNIQGQDVTESIVDLFGSNECVGTDTTTQSPAFSLTTTPSLVIAGNFFNFVSQGGQQQDPTLSGATGQGGIFVDTNGTFEILPNYRALMGKVVAVSGNGVVDLPATQVLFVNGAAIQRWHLNLGSPAQQVIVPAGQQYSNFMLDWQATSLDVCSTTSYVPYNFLVTNPTTGCPELAYLNPLTTGNLTGLPIVYGEVDQLQLKNGTIGNQPAVIVDGSFADQSGPVAANGLVREIVFLNGTTPGTAPVGMVVIQNDATVGIGTSLRGDPVSTQAQMVLGTNGLTLVANGNGTVMLNQDVLINNLCHFLTGPNFGLTSKQNLTITSQVPREIRVKGTGIIDLTQFGNYNKRLTIGGQVKLVLEPGAQIIQGSGELYFTDNAEMVLEPFVNAQYPAGTLPSSTDAYRVKYSSVNTGTSAATSASRLTLQENSSVFIPRGALLGVETNTCVTGTTSTSWFINDDATFFIGGNTTLDEYGGGLQIGNTTSQTGAWINWALTLNGTGATFEVGSQGFLGIGQGIVNKPNTGPDFWVIGDIANVGAVSITLTEGTLINQTIVPAPTPPQFPGRDPLASLLALGYAAGGYTFSFDRVNSLILGGGNLLITGSATGPFNPVVATTNGPVSTIGTQEQTVNYNAGVLASKATLVDISKTSGSTANPFSITGNSFTVGTFITMNDYRSQISKTTVVAPIGLAEAALAYVYNGVIYRPTQKVFQSGGIQVGPVQAYAIGAATLALNTQTLPPAPTVTILNP